MQLLLDAALLKKPEALASWQTFLQQNDIQTIEHSALVLLPLVYRNLQEESHPLCKSIYRHTWVSNQSQWANALPTLNKLLDAGIEKIGILKGMALILDHYRDFGVRVIGDIDILIDPYHAPLAHSLLLDWGWRCVLPRFDPKNPFQLSRWHAVNYIHPSGLNLDLHWSLILESTPALTKEILKGIPPGIHSLDPTDLFFQTCIRGNKKSTAPLIRWVPDALTLLSHSSVDFPRLFKLAEDHHVTLSLSSALTYLTKSFGATIPPFNPQTSPYEVREFRANLRGNIYLAGYYRARLRNHSLIHYLQHTANLTSPWMIPFYAPCWVCSRLYRFLKKRLRSISS